MEPARVRFLEEGEEPVLPKWTKLLPQRWRQRKTVDTYPYTLTRVDGVLTGILKKLCQPAPLGKGKPFSGKFSLGE